MSEMRTDEFEKAASDALLQGRGYLRMTADGRVTHVPLNQAFNLPNSNGVALSSAPHPRSPWWRRVWFWFRQPRLSRESLETIEIEIPDRKDS